MYRNESGTAALAREKTGLGYCQYKVKVKNTDMLPISVAVVAENEEDRLPDCLESVAFADEIVVVDSGSKDNTVSIARDFGCKLLAQEWLGYARQKQYAVDHCKHDWVLILDADERIPERTKKEIVRLFSFSEQNKYGGYIFSRKNYFHNRWIRHCGWWPNQVLRLVDRRQGRFSDNIVHESWICDGEIKKLDHAIVHHSFRNYADMINKMQAYSTLAAKEMAQNGRHARWWLPLTHGLWMFIRTYFLELGLVEGFDGFMISLLNAGGSFLKYAKLREARIYGNLNI